MKLTITASSTALFSTWIFVEELGVLFDAGDGVSAALTQKSGKIRNIFITHADRDHVCGLLQLHQLNARDGKPRIHYPRDSGSFPALREFVARFDPQSGPADWIGIQDDQAISIDQQHTVLTHPSAHITKDQQVKALSYTVVRTRSRLRAEFHGLSGKEIAEKKKTLGEEAVAEPVTENLIGYSGDCPALEPSAWSGVRILLHEATFLEPETARGQHAHVEQVIRSASTLGLEALILLHFSMRYKPTEISNSIQQHANQYRPPFPIYALMPGQVHRDVLAQEPVWQP